MRSKIFICFFLLLSVSTIKAQNTTLDTINNPYWLHMMDCNTNYYKVKRAYDLYFSNKVKKRGTGFKRFERWSNRWSSSITASGEFFPANHVQKEVVKFNRSIITPRSNSGNWINLGPTQRPIRSTWAGGDSINTGTGRLNVIAFHPTDSNIMYVGAPAGGLWKTTNKGASWTNLTDGLPSLGVSAIMLFPDSLNKIMIGTGDRDANDSRGMGIYISRDGGTNWTSSNNGVVSNGIDVTINKIVINRLNPKTVIAISKITNGNSFRLFKSTNQGVKWDSINVHGICAYGNSSITDIVYHPIDTNILYASTRYPCESIYKSINGGVTWTAINNGLTSTPRYRSMLAVTAAAPNVVYLISCNLDRALDAVYKSSNAGQSWTVKCDINNFNLLGYDQFGQDALGQGEYDLAILSSPTDSNYLIVGGVNIHGSSNGGSVWNNKSMWYDPYVHADIHFLAQNPLTNACYIASDGGLDVTNNNFTTFKNLNNGLAISQMHNIDVSQLSPNRLIMGLQDNATFVFRRNQNWKIYTGGDGGIVALSNKDTNFMVSSSQYGNFEINMNNGNTYWERINDVAYGLGVPQSDAGFITPMDLDPNRSQIAVLGYKDIFISKDIHKTLGDPTNYGFSQISNNTTSSKASFVKFSNKSTKIAFVGFDYGEMICINNLDTTLTSTPNLIAMNTPSLGGAIKSIETSYIDTNTLYIATEQKVYKSTNRGNTWTNISYNLPAIGINAIVLDKYSNEGIYVGTEGGVYYKENNATSWQSFNTGLPLYAPIKDFDIWYDTLCSNNSKMFLATYGRGAFESDLKNAEITLNASFTLPGGTYNAGVPITLTNTSIGNTKNKWTIDSINNVLYNTGSNDSSSSPSIIFSKPGTYKIRLKTMNAYGRHCYSSYQTITVLNTPLNVTASKSTNATICGGDTVAITANGALTYVISPIINTLKVNDSVFKVFPDSTTNYMIIGTSGLLKDTAFLSVTATKVNSPTTDSVNIIRCYGFKFQDFVPFISGSNLKFFATNTDTSSLLQSNIIPKTSVNGKSYYISQTLSGCTSKRIAVKITIPTFDTSCTITNNSIQSNMTYGNYQWYNCISNGKVKIINATSSSFSPKDTGFYSVKISYGSCIDSSICRRIVYCTNSTSGPIVTSPQNFCDSTKISGLQATGNNLKWYSSNTFSNPLLSSYSILNNTTLFLSEVDSFGCETALSNLDVLITKIDTTVSLVGKVLTAIYTGATYKWVNCSSNTYITGATSRTYTPTTSGNYAVEITKNTCKKRSACRQITSASLQNIIENKIKLYPNPVYNEFEIDLNSFYSSIDILVFDELGKLVDAKNYKNVVKINSEFKQKSGMYFVRIQENGKELTTFKVLKVD